jgi:hypothetical protein
MNGIGSKACNIFPRGRIETVDHELKKLYKQTWTENMSICHPPKITACKNLPIHASFLPTTLVSVWKRWTLMKALLLKHTTPPVVTDASVTIFINKVNQKFPNYAELFIGRKTITVTSKEGVPGLSRPREKDTTGRSSQLHGTHQNRCRSSTGVYDSGRKARGLRSQPNHQEGKRPDQQTEQGRQRQTTARQGQTVPYTQEARSRTPFNGQTKEILDMLTRSSRGERSKFRTSSWKTS